jgi:hypothetical protein
MRFASDGTQGSSIFGLQVYAQRTIGTDDYIGELKDTVEILFANSTIDDPTPPIVATRNLCKIDKRGNSQELPTVAKFTISSFKMSDEATSVQLDRVVSQAKEAYEHIVPLPSAMASACDAVGVAADTIPSVNDTLTTWEPLLDKVKLVTEIVDKIAEE